MTTLSLAMIVRDAEPTLERVLESAKQICDELIVVDTGSTDRSAEIAKRLGAKVHKFAWIDDFGAARNCSFQHCTGDWIMWLDSDDVLSEASSQRLLEVKNAIHADGTVSVDSGVFDTGEGTDAPEAIDAIYLPYQTSFNAIDKGEFTVYRERILRRQAGLEWCHPVHECIDVPPERALFLHDVFVEHRPTIASRAAKKPGRNLRIIEKALSDGDQSERMLFYYGNELFDNEKFEEAIDAYKCALNAGLRPFESYWATRAIGNCYSGLEQFDHALDWGMRAIEVDPERAEALNDVGMLYYRQKLFAEAVTFLSRATKLQKPRTSFVEDCHYEWLPYEYLSSCYMGTGDYQKALENGLKALVDHPDKGRLQENIKFLTRVAASAS